MAQINFLQIEEEILKFWREKEIFNKSLSKKAPQGNFVFFEGPPTANGRPHIGHALTRFYKDAVLRYKTMQGFHVDRKAGWDTQGLPVELEVEKEIGISGKPDIEKFGIDKFNQKCRENVWKYKDEWEKMTERIGFWLDLKHPYVTYDSSYIETVWWILSKIWNKGLLYQDYKVVPYCPRCGTALSSHEVAQGYQNIEEESVYLKFKLKNQENTYLLVWTTTPWTLPANLAVAVGKNIDYVKVKVLDVKERAATGKIEYQNLIIAKNIFEGLYNKEDKHPLKLAFDLVYAHNKEEGEKAIKSAQIIEEFKGNQLIGLEYNSLYNIYQGEKYYKVYAADFVSTEDGTGLVHIAPHYGEDDYNLFIDNNLAIPNFLTVNGQGEISVDVPGKGKFVKDADKDIKNDLENRYILLTIENYAHDYPFCWRCKTPLIYYARLSWFIKVTDPQVKENLIKNSQTINWVPAHIKEGRFGEWLKNIRDWAISRERYWGTPLPIWECQKCKHRECVGSFEELAKKTNKNLGENFDPHRPQIDELTWSCTDCGGEMKRVLEVLDCWFDSGSMPFAQWHYPFENVEKIDGSQSYPADFISEAMDQTRGWFYSLLAISTLIDKGASYKNVICLDFVLDAAGEKMSKSKGNVVSWDAVDQYGADPIRWFLYTVNQSSESKSFDPAEIKKATQRMFLIFWNVFEFYNTYGLKVSDPPAGGKKSENIIDQWILTKFSLLIKEISQKMDKYDLTGTTRAIEAFITDLSQWYLRRSRDRFADKQEEASQTLYYILLNLTKLLAPFTPFCAEKLYLDLTQGKIKESVHLDSWPTADEELIKQGEKLLEEMETVRKICEISHNLRLKAKIKVRQPLKTLSIKMKPFANQGLIDLIKNEVNLKEINFVENLPQGDGQQTNEDSEIKITLEINITPELKKEGLARELTRNINSLRKESGLTQKDQVDIYYQTSFEDLKEVMNDFANLLKEKTASKNIFEKIPEQSLIQKEFDIDGNKMSIALVLAEN